jgi:hypothetical protein
VKTIQLTLKSHDSRVVSAYVDDSFPGLAVHKVNGDGSGWRISHVEAGYNCSGKKTLDTRRDAVATAQRMSKVYDYTRPVEHLEQLKYDDPLAVKIREGVFGPGT